MQAQQHLTASNGFRWLNDAFLLWLMTGASTRYLLIADALAEVRAQLLRLSRAFSEWLWRNLGTADECGRQRTGETAALLAIRSPFSKRLRSDLHPLAHAGRSMAIHTR